MHKEPDAQIDKEKKTVENYRKPTEKYMLNIKDIEEKKNRVSQMTKRSRNKKSNSQRDKHEDKVRQTRKLLHEDINSEKRNQETARRIRGNIGIKKN